MVGRSTLPHGGRKAHRVTERGGMKRLLGYVARSSVTPGGWAYKPDGWDIWIMPGFRRAEAVDHLQSAWHPQARYLKD